MIFVRPSFLILLLLMTLFSFAQNSGKISGTIVNANTRTPIEYASVSLVNDQSQKAVNGVITDAHGNFSLPGVPPGKYNIKVDFVGFKSTVRTFVIAGTTKMDIGTITLD